MESNGYIQAWMPFMSRATPALGACGRAREGIVSEEGMDGYASGPEVFCSYRSPTATTPATGRSGTAQGRARGVRAAAVSTALVAVPRERRAGRSRKRRSLKRPPREGSLSKDSVVRRTRAPYRDVGGWLGPMLGNLWDGMKP